MRREHFQSVLIRPQPLRKGDFAEYSETVGLKPSAVLASVPLIAVILDPLGEPNWLASMFLAKCALQARSVTGDTVRSYAEALLVWLSFLNKFGETQTDASEERLGSFRAYMVNAPGNGGRKYSTATANHRVTIATRFHLWGQRTGLLKTTLGEYLMAWQESHRPTSRHSLALRMGRPYAPTAIRRAPVVLSKTEIQKLLAVAPQPYKLMFKWGLTTGMRRFEVCDLKLQDLPRPQRMSANGSELVKVAVVRKGNRALTVHVPERLIEETRWYVLAERPRPENKTEASVFLNKRGRPISRASLSNTFRTCADSFGSDATLHHLRHTYAIRVLKALEGFELEGKAINSLKTLQVLMGHASMTTTEIYTEAAEPSGERVFKALDFLYGETL